jgi:hypothetical protein
MDIEVIRRICLARYLYEVASASLRSSNDVHLFAGVNLLQDAVEAFLLAVGEQVAAAIDSNTKFDKYFTEINAKIEPKNLPFRLQLPSCYRFAPDQPDTAAQRRTGYQQKPSLNMPLSPVGARSHYLRT